VSEEPTRPAASREDLDEKLKLVEFSYKEVLDATKHQDDKIGRMLTSVAFLTAASIALAGLSSAAFLTRPYVVAPFTVPLGLVALVVFLSGVVFTVVLLLTSLATPLRIPGIAESSQVPRRRTQTWVGDVKASQLYFYSISGVTLGAWERKWEASADELKEERFELLVRETHNIGVRTTFKYDRGTEASALLSFSLLAFGLAVILEAVAAGTPGTAPVHLGQLQRVVLGAMLGCYCWLQLVARLLYAHQSIDEPPTGVAVARAAVRSVSEKCFAGLLTLLVLGVVAYDRGGGIPTWLATTLLLVLVGVTLTSFWGASTVVVQTDSSGARVADVKRATRRNRLIVTGLAAVVAALGVVAVNNGWYALQLLLAVAIVVLLVGTSALAPTLTAASRRRNALPA
jgi:hypothetical protein